jgi:hypothetical protein
MIITGIVASPRKGKNTDKFVQSVLDGVSLDNNVKVKKIYLNDLKIIPCQACSKFPRTYCHFNDDMNIIYNALENSDGIVIGTPAYYNSISAQLKIMIDRCNCLAKIKKENEKIKIIPRIKKIKKGIFIWIADVSKDPSHALAIMKIWSKYAQVEIIENIIITNSEKIKKNELLNYTFSIGKKLANAIKMLKI